MSDVRRRRAPPVTRQHHVYCHIHYMCVTWCANQKAKKIMRRPRFAFYLLANRTSGHGAALQYDIPTIGLCFFTEPDFF
jgi:hypothetical protein